VLRNDAVPIRQRDSSIPKKLAEVIDLAFNRKAKNLFSNSRRI
jgi:hypothetical protein